MKCKLKIICTLLLCGLMTNSLSMTVFGAEDTPVAAVATQTDADSQEEENNSTKEADGESTSSQKVNIYIDNKNKYDGMNITYQDGYIPSINDGQAIIVIPLICDGQIKDNTIKTNVNLGDAANAPFVIKNYEKDVPLSMHSINDQTGTTECFLVVYRLDLKSDRVNGSYPVIIDIKAVTPTGEQIAESFKTFVNISDGKNPDEEVNEEDVDIPTFEPKVLIQGYEYSVDEIVAGDEITASITLVNTSQTNGVKNMTVTVSDSSEHLTLLSQTDTLYIESIGAGEKHVVTFKYKVSAVAPAGQYDLQLAMDYADYNGATYGSNGTAKLNVAQPVKVQFDPVELSSKLEVADVIELSISAMNLGKGKVYNVRATVDMEGLNPDGTIFIGDMEPGTKKSAATAVSVTSLSGPSGYGETSGTITFIYEDENGNEYTFVQELATYIESPFANLPDEKTKDKTSQWWVIMVVIAVVLAGFVLTALLGFLRKRKLFKEE